MKAIPTSREVTEIVEAVLKTIEDRQTQSAPQLVTIKKAAELTGYTESAIRNKINIGIWPENVVWKWGEDGVQLIIWEGYNKWARQLGRASMRGRRQSASTSFTLGTNTSSL